jgi:predicted AAA+ superfamily ATPase
MRICAAPSYWQCSATSLAADCGITHTTAKRWLSVLEASFLVMLLLPYHRNYGKRLIKSPKLYFLDSGLLCYLLRVQTAEELHNHAARGAIFESFVVSELYKNFAHRGERPEIYFWRDAAGHEVDFVIEAGRNQIMIEAKSAQTVASDFFDGLKHLRRLSAPSQGRYALVYGGNQAYVRNKVTVHPWFNL